MYVLPFSSLIQRYTPNFFRLSAKILALSTSALLYLTIGLTSIKFILRLSSKLSLPKEVNYELASHTAQVKFFL